MRVAVALAAACLGLMVGPAPVQAQAAPPIAEIRVHGNHSTPDADVLAVSALAVGQPAGDQELSAAAARLRASGRFRTVEVLRRSRSIDNPDDVLVLVMVEEVQGAAPDMPTPGRLRQFAAGLMWVPVLSYDDRYGLTYGVHIAALDLVGRESRVALPLTWGGERRAGIEIERSFDGGVVSRLAAGGGVRRTEHPAFDVPERRTGGHARAERAVTPALRLGVAASLEEVRFSGTRDPVSTVGADLTLDTRTDPAFPRNAVWGRVEVERLGVEAGARRRHRIDANAAVGLFRGSVLSARVFQVSSDGALPAYEQAFIGGVATLRGFRPGYRVSDNAAGASTTWTLPFGSPLAVTRTGVRVFVDWAAVYAAESSWRDASFDRGAGAGVFATVGAFTLGVDVARGGQRTRVHVRAGTRF